MNILTLHGINLNTHERYTYHKQWQKWLGYLCFNLNWQSTGTISGDLAKLTFNKKFREDTIDTLAFWIMRWYECEGPFIFVAHSMGVALGAAALERCSGLPDVPFLGIGGPVGHPLLWRRLRAMGLGLKTRKGVHFYNQDDGVTSFFRHYKKIDNWEHIPVAIPGDGGFVKEHADKFYLTHPVFYGQMREMQN